MTHIFLAVMEISISISLLITVLLLLTPLLDRRYAAKWKYWIWIFLALRLILPFHGADVRAVVDAWSQKESRFELRPGEKDTESLPEQTMSQGRIMIEIPARMMTPIAPSSEENKMHVTPLDMAAFIWMMGSLAFMLTHLISYVRYKNLALKGGSIVRDKGILRRVFELKRELQIKDSVHIIEYPEAASPMVIGFLQSVLILPETQYDPVEQYFILKHELVHLKRRDVYIKLLLVAANAVHWFNPLVWIMQKEAAVDMELSCDERVTQGADRAARKAYTETLLSTLHRRCAGRTVLSTQFYGGKKIMKKRFENILLKTGKKNGAVILMCAVLLTLSLGTLVGCSVTGGNGGNTSGQAGSGNTEGQAGSGNIEGQTGLAHSGNAEGTPDQSGGGQSSSGTDVTDASNTGNNLTDGNNLSGEILVYVHEFDGATLAYDAIEWVQVPGERAAELGLTEDDAPSGFSIYNAESVTEELPLASDCTCTLLDWTANYVEMQVTTEELKDILAEREGTAIPYHLTIQGNEIIGITEQYVP